MTGDILAAAGGPPATTRRSPRLKRARAARPDLTWWQFLRTDAIALSVAAALVAGFAALPEEQREAAQGGLRELAELLSIVRWR